MAPILLSPRQRIPELLPDPLDKLTTLIILIVLLRLLGGC